MFKAKKTKVRNVLSNELISYIIEVRVLDRSICSRVGRIAQSLTQFRYSSNLLTQFAGEERDPIRVDCF